MINGALLLEAISEIASEKNIKPEVIHEGIKDGFKKAFERFFDTEAIINVVIDDQVGTIRMFQIYDVVDTIDDDWLEIDLAGAKKLDPTAKIGEKVRKEIEFNEEFGRLAVQQASSTFRQKIRSAERENIYNTFFPKQGEIVRAKVVGMDETGKIYILEIDGVQTGLWINKTINEEVFEAEQFIDVLIEQVSRDSKYSQLIVSRTAPKFLEKILEREIPEISSGDVEIVAISREAGKRAKVAVLSHDPNIEAVGTIIGQKGNRINRISGLLKGEKIDVINYSNDTREFMMNAMSPVKVISINEIDGEYDVVVPNEQLSLAIGKSGSTARLVANLLNVKLNIYSQDSAIRDNMDILWNGNITMSEVESKSFLERKSRPVFNYNNNANQSLYRNAHASVDMEELADFQAKIEENPIDISDEESEMYEKIAELNLKNDEVSLNELQASIQALNEDDEDTIEPDDDLDEYDEYYE